MLIMTAEESRQRVYEKFKGAASKGKFFNRSIKGILSVS